jgi:hypothetical protein
MALAPAGLPDLRALDSAWRGRDGGLVGERRLEGAAARNALGLSMSM